MYTIGNFLIGVKNSYMAGKKTAEFPFSKVAFSLGKIMEEEGYLKKIKETEKDGKKYLVAELRYQGNRPSVSDIKLASKPSLHNYVRKNAVKKTVSNYGISIVSTSKGLMSGKKAFKEGLGGELICQILS